MTELAWNYGDIFDAIGAEVPHRPALICGAESWSWADVSARSNRIARAWLSPDGIEVGQSVAFLLRNDPAYLEGVIAAFKARLVHVNVNYRYVADELHYVIDNADATILVYGTEFADRVAELRDRLKQVRVYVEVGSAVPVNDFAIGYEELARFGDGSKLEIERSPDDLLILYTGGTTGLPKGVMWRQADRLAVYAGKDGGGTAREFLDRSLASAPARHLPAAPLMHSTGLTSSLAVLATGGSVIILPRRFDPERLWDAVDAHAVRSLAIVGDAFAVPLLRTLQENPDRWNLGSLKQIQSAGVMWSDDNKEGLVARLPDVMLIDTFGSSEGSGLGRSVWHDGKRQPAGEFRIGAQCRVFDEDGKEIEPGSDTPGLIAKSGAIPVGYYKDPVKTAQVFPTIEGTRYAIPGDFCLVREDGTLVLLGRGSGCINTGGEKVFPEEVEQALKRHRTIDDALVVGLPSDRWGQMIVAVVQASEPDAVPEEAALRAHMREHLADYKVPKRIVFVEDLRRAENGKPDYEFARVYAQDALAREEASP